MEGAQYVLWIFQVLRLSSKQTYLPAYVAYILVRTKDEEAEKEYKLVSTWLVTQELVINNKYNIYRIG